MAYRKAYSTNHVLLRLIGKWKSALDNKNFVRAELMDLSKAFGRIHHDLLIAKLHAYGFSKNNLTLSLRKKCLYLEFFWSVFSRIWTEYGEIRSISPYAVRMRENTDRKTANTDSFYAMHNYRS